MTVAMAAAELIIARSGSRVRPTVPHPPHTARGQPSCQIVTMWKAAIPRLLTTTGFLSVPTGPLLGATGPTRLAAAAMTSLRRLAEAVRERTREHGERFRVGIRRGRPRDGVVEAGG
jgi:hypothetical protein